MKDCWIPTFIEAENINSPATKFFGNPLGKRDNWPLCPDCGKPLFFIFQINYDDLPKAFTEQIGQEQGIIQLFHRTYCWGADYPDPYEFSVFTHLVYYSGDEIPKLEIMTPPPSLNETNDLPVETKEQIEYFLDLTPNILSELKKTKDYAYEPKKKKNAKNEGNPVFGPKFGGYYTREFRSGPVECNICGKNMNLIATFYGFGFWDEPAIWIFQCPNHPNQLMDKCDMLTG